MQLDFNNFAVLPKNLFESDDISHRDFVLFTLLSVIINKHGEARETNQQLATLSKLHVNAVRQSLAKLKKANLIVVNNPDNNITRTITTHEAIAGEKHGNEFKSMRNDFKMFREAVLTYLPGLRITNYKNENIQYEISKKDYLIHEVGNEFPLSKEKANEIWKWLYKEKKNELISQITEKRGY